MCIVDKFGVNTESKGINQRLKPEANYNNVSGY